MPLFENDKLASVKSSEILNETHPEHFSEIDAISLPEFKPSPLYTTIENDKDMDINIKAMFKLLDIQGQKIDWISKALFDTNRQVRRTNGNIIKIKHWVADADDWREDVKDWIKRHNEEHSTTIKEAISAYYTSKRKRDWIRNIVSGVIGAVGGLGLLEAAVHFLVR